MYKKTIFARNIKRAEESRNDDFFSFFSCSCLWVTGFFLNSFSSQSSRPRFTFFSSCQELVLLLFVFFFPQLGKKKKKHAMMASARKKEMSEWDGAKDFFDSVNWMKKKLYCGCLFKGCMMMIFLPRMLHSSHTERENRRNEKYTFLIRLKIKRKKIRDKKLSC